MTRLNHWLYASPTADVFAQPPDPATLPRFVQSGGTVLEQIAGRAHVLPLVEARRRYEEWFREAVLHDARGEHVKARLYGRPAALLCSAVLAAEIWTRAQGRRA